MFVKALMFTAAMASTQLADAAPQGGPVHSIAIVDLKPSHAAAGTLLLSDHVSKLRQAPGVASVALIQQAGSTNHFIIDTVFQSETAYQDAIESADVLAFRRDVYPHLGGPWDERLGHDAAP